jgi:glycosyltransferase involved in cell wall biosynthesis
MILVRELSGTDVPLISVVVCAYNHERYIAECLASIDSVLDASAIEVIVIDDGSPDRTLEIATNFAFKPGLAVRIYAKPNKGLTDSLALGVQLARGRFLSPMASDDRYAPGGLDAAIALYAAGGRERTVTVCGAIYLEEPTGRRSRDGMPVYQSDATRLFNATPASRYRGLCVRYPTPMLLQSSIFPTEVLREVAAWRDGLELDDWPTFIKIARAEVQGRLRFEFAPDLILTRYRVHAGGVHNNTERMTRICLQVTDIEVPPRYRARSRAFIHRQTALMRLNKRDVRGFNQAYRAGIAADPGLVAIFAAPTRILIAGFRRLGSALAPRRP